MPTRGPTLLSLCLATAIGALGLAAGGTAGALLGTALIAPGAAGLPLGLLVAGSAAAALVISRRSARAGRTRSLALGYAAGAVGAALAVLASATRNVALLLLGSTLLGAANAAIFLTRYAAAELGAQHARGRALGTVLAATAVGAVASPNLLGPSGTLAAALGLPRLAGLYGVAVVAFGVAAVLLAQTAPAPSVDQSAGRPGTRTLPIGPTPRDLARALKTRQVRAALLMLAASNLIMVAVMTIAPVDMATHGHTLTLIGVIISLHVAGMFAPSLLTGWLADRTGPTVVATLGLVLLAGTGLAGTLTTLDDPLATTTILVALGLGWNCGVVGGSTLLATSVAPALRAHVEGIGESTMGIAAAVSAPLAGVTLAIGSMPGVWALTTALAILVLLIIRPSGGAILWTAHPPTKRTRERP